MYLYGKEQRLNNICILFVMQVFSRTILESGDEILTYSEMGALSKKASEPPFYIVKKIFNID